MMLFADGTNAFVINNDLNQLKQSAGKLLSNLCEWFTANNLILNMNKTNCGIFHPPRKIISTDYNSLTVGHTIINRVNCVKYLD